ncbi:MAG: hypothetical protein H6680_04995 [Desulfobacteraceae bacterium]|nr:hypothetical protein [Desulfobacteraceae bacterium]
MTKNYKCSFFEFSEEDVVDAMKSMEGYIDITTGTFREIYELAYQHAVKRMLGTMPVKNIMTAPVHCVSDDTDVADAARFLAERRVSGALLQTGKVKFPELYQKRFFKKNGF